MDTLSELENIVLNAQGGGTILPFALQPCSTNHSIYSENFFFEPLWVSCKRKQEQEEQKRKKIEEAKAHREREEEMRRFAEEEKKRLLAEDRLKRGTADSVDLGLSVLWSSHNIGARSCEQSGVYASWLQKKEVLNVWGEDWRMPTVSEMMELMQKCQWQWSVIKGIPGFCVIGVNGNHIFLPAVGSCVSMQYDGYGVIGRYWCDNADVMYIDRAMYIEFNQGSGNIFSMAKTMQMSVRPVKNK